MTGEQQVDGEGGSKRTRCVGSHEHYRDYALSQLIVLLEFESALDHIVRTTGMYYLGQNEDGPPVHELLHNTHPLSCAIDSASFAFKWWLL